MSPESLEYILTNSSMMPRLEKIRTASVDYFVKVLKNMLREVTRIFAKPSRIHCYVTKSYPITHSHLVTPCPSANQRIRSSHQGLMSIHSTPGPGAEMSKGKVKVAQSCPTL